MLSLGQVALFGYRKVSGLPEWVWVGGWELLVPGMRWFCFLPARIDSFQTDTLVFQALIPEYCHLYALRWSSHPCATASPAMMPSLPHRPCCRSCPYCTCGLNFRLPSSSHLVIVLSLISSGYLALLQALESSKGSLPCAAPAPSSSITCPLLCSYKAQPRRGAGLQQALLKKPNTESCMVTVGWGEMDR